MPRYARYPSSRRSFFYDSFTPGVKWLLIANTATFVAIFLVHTSIEDILGALSLSTPGVLRKFYVWQLVTYMFLHGGIMHLLFNMLTLWMFGTPLERDWGTRRFLKYYFYCGIAAGVCVVAVNAIVGDWVHPTIGASGAIFGLLVAFGVLYPNQTVLMNFLFPIKAKYMVIIYAAIELMLTFGPNTGVSTVAHLGGMAFGYVYLKWRLPGLALPDFAGAYRQWQMRRAKKKFQTYMNKQGRGPWVN